MAAQILGHHHDDVPGTVLLFDESHVGSESIRRGDIVLQPRPSSDPEDPLNWSQTRKYICVTTVYIYILGIGIATTVQNSVIAQIAQEQNMTLTEINLGAGLMFLFLGWGCLIWQPLAMTYGRRGVYLITTILCIGPVLWTAHSKGAGQWYTHRILLGILASPVESLPEVSIPDIFFAHERGTYMAIYATFIFGSNFLAPFFAGFINDSAGWSWVMYFAALCLATSAVVTFFFMEETIYFRDTSESTILVEMDSKTDGSHIVDPNSQPSIATSPGRALSRYRLVTFLPGRPTPKQMLLKSWRSLKIIVLFPNIAWAGMIYGTNLSWYMVINATMSPILSSPPYNFAPRMVGVAYLSPFVAALISCLWAGRFADWTALFLARRNNGIREAEHRLWALLVSAFLASGGLVLWGIGASRQLPYMALIIGLGMVTFGIVCGGAVSLAYAVDCFKEITGESMASIMIIRNTLGFAFGYAITPWIDGLGLQNCFISVGLISVVCTLSFLGMNFWGKMLRRKSANRYWRYVTAERASGSSSSH